MDILQAIYKNCMCNQLPSFNLNFAHSTASHIVWLTYLSQGCGSKTTPK